MLIGAAILYYYPTQVNELDRLREFILGSHSDWQRFCEDLQVQIRRADEEARSTAPKVPPGVVTGFRVKKIANGQPVYQATEQPQRDALQAGEMPSGADGGAKDSIIAKESAIENV